MFCVPMQSHWLLLNAIFQNNGKVDIFSFLSSHSIGAVVVVCVDSMEVSVVIGLLWVDLLVFHSWLLTSLLRGSLSLSMFLCLSRFCCWLWPLFCIQKKNAHVYVSMAFVRMKKHYKRVCLFVIFNVCVCAHTFSFAFDRIGWGDMWAAPSKLV